METQNDVKMAISLEGYLKVTEGVRYKICLSLPTSSDQANLLIGDLLRKHVSLGERTKCYEFQPIRRILKITVEYFWSTRYEQLPLVLQWQYSDLPQAIVPSTAWVEVRMTSIILQDSALVM